MPRITLFIPSLVEGGLERVFVNLAHGLVQRNIEVDMVLMHAEGPFLKALSPQVHIFEVVPDVHSRWAKLRYYLQRQHTFSLMSNAFIKVNFFAFRLAGYLLRNKILNCFSSCLLYGFQFADYLRHRKPVSVLSASTHCNLISLIGKRFVGRSYRSVISEHSTPSIAWRNNPSGSAWLYFARRLYHQANSIVAVSQGVAEDLRQLLDLTPNQVQVIYNPVVTSEIFLKAREPINHPWFEDNHSQPIILAVGRLNKEKDYPTLFRAFRLVRDSRPCRLVILGEGEERQSLEQLSVRMGIKEDVYMPGFVDNPFAFMARASVFVLSSAWEGLPTVLIEALACGCPVVSTDCRSGPREILDNGRYGRLVPVGDHEALAKAILETLEDPDKPADRETRIQRAMEFSVDVAVDRYLKVLLP